jgi:aryl-alcohol dehydrogenase
VLVRMVATGVCHTDLKAAGDDSPVPKPAVLGHEGAGVVEEVGAGVTKLAPGDAVVMTFDSCGRCPSCRDAQPSYCHNANHFVSQRGAGEHYLSAGAEPVTGDFFSQSSFATHAIGTERSVVRVRDDAPLEQLGPLGCGIQTGAGAVLNDFKMKPGQSLAVFGSGTLGLAAVMAARIAGAARIVAIDRHAHRLELAEELGADDTILAGNEPVGEQVLDLVAGGVDFTLDTTSVPEVMGQAIRVLAPRGTCGFVTGAWDGTPLPVPVRHLVGGGRAIRGIGEGGSNPDVFIPRLVDFFMDGRLPIDRLSRKYAFDDIAQAFLDSHEGDTVKPILMFG